MLIPTPSALIRLRRYYLPPQTMVPLRPNLPEGLREPAEQALDWVERHLTPAPPERIRQLLDGLFLMFKPVPPQQASLYAGLLAEVPPDILNHSFMELLRHYRYAHAPRPADILQLAEPPLAERRYDRRKLQQLLHWL